MYNGQYIKVKQVKIIDSSIIFKGNIIKGKKKLLKKQKMIEQTQFYIQIDLNQVKKSLKQLFVEKTKGLIKIIFLEENKKIFNTELWIILKALRFARKKTLNNRNTPITIFCDF